MYSGAILRLIYPLMIQNLSFNGKPVIARSC